MRRIELIGASGVGKTTLYKKLRRVTGANRMYLTLKDAYKAAALNCKIPLGEVKLLFYQQLLRTGMVKSKERGLGKVILMEHLKGKSDQRSKYNSFRVSFDILYHYLKNEASPFLVEKMLKTFLKAVDDYLLLEHGLPGNDIVMVDEGIIHSHIGITEYGFQEYNYQQLKMDPAFSPDGIIHCSNTEEVVFKQALKRKQEGIKTFGHGHLNRVELREAIQRSLLKNRKKAEGFMELGIPVLKINTGEKFEVISNKINKFSSCLSN